MRRIWCAYGGSYDALAGELDALGYFELSPPETVSVEDDGFTRFVEQPEGMHRYLRVSPEQVIRIQAPPSGPGGRLAGVDAPGSPWHDAVTVFEVGRGTRATASPGYFEASWHLATAFITVAEAMRNEPEFVEPLTQIEARQESGPC